jgi:molybdate ABC transporter permease protein
MPSDFTPLWISLRAATLATLLTFGLGIAAARWMLTYRGKARSLLDGLLTLPLVLPPTVVGFLLLVMLGKNSPLGQLLRQAGINLIFTWYATVIAATVVAFPLMYKTVLGAFEQIEPDLLSCARTLGASEWRIFWQVLLPLAVPGIAAGTILSFARALGEFGATLMIAGNIPGVTQTIPLAIFFTSEAGRMGEAFTWVGLMIALSLFTIGLIHLLTSAQDRSRGKATRVNPLTHRILNVLLLGQVYSQWEQQQKERARLAPLDSAVSAQSTLPAPSLVVNIRKPLRGFTLEAAFSTNGTPLGILGASGSGKSMTLRCIAGLETPAAGQILLNNRVLFDAQRGINVPSAKRRIGVVFQNYALFPHLNVVQNIAFGLQDCNLEVRSQRIDHYLHRLQLEGLELRYPHQLSGGQQQRVALARAMAIAPDALVLDEPLSALDTYLRSRIEDLLANVLSTYRGAVLFVTHNLEEVYRVCPTLMVMESGRAIALGSKYEIFEHPQTPSVAQITGCKNFSRAVPRGAYCVEAIDWNCLLTTVEPVPATLTQVGIRAHQLHFLDVMPLVSTSGQDTRLPNVFPCWLVRTSETQHRMTLYLKLHAPSESPNDYHLQAEVFKEKWAVLKNQPLPWKIQLEPIKTILLTDEPFSPRG